MISFMYFSKIIPIVGCIYGLPGLLQRINQFRLLVGYPMAAVRNSLDGQIIYVIPEACQVAEISRP